MADGEDKRITRSQANATSSGNYLGFGDYLFGAKARVSVRSPTPSPVASPNVIPNPNGQIFFPSPESRSLPPSSRQTPTATIMGDQAIASLSSALSGLQVSSRKPDLPAFDKNSVDKWIRRVESAYIRAGITSAREKFAFIESRFPVDEDPAVDEYLFGEPSDQNWDNFCAYLRKRHGKTKQQKVAAILEPMGMDGRTPSQYYAKLRQSFDDITLDDVVREICVRQLPADIQQTICKDTEKMSAKELTEFADKYYNPDGSRLHKKAQSVNAIRTSQQQTTTTATAATAAAYSQPFQDDNETEEINAIRGRQNFNSGRQNNNGFSGGRSKSRNRFPNNNKHGNNGNNNNNFASRNNIGGFGNNNGNSRNNTKQHDPSMCFYHNMYGEKARKCDIGCSKSNSGNGLSPRQ